MIFTFTTESDKKNAREKYPWSHATDTDILWNNSLRIWDVLQHSLVIILFPLAEIYLHFIYRERVATIIFDLHKAKKIQFLCSERNPRRKKNETNLKTHNSYQKFMNWANVAIVVVITLSPCILEVFLQFSPLSLIPSFIYFNVIYIKRILLYFFSYACGKFKLQITTHPSSSFTTSFTGNTNNNNNNSNMNLEWRTDDVDMSVSPTNGTEGNPRI